MAIAAALKASTDQLRSKADQINGTVGQIEHCMQSLVQALNNTGTYWRGEAADKHRKEMTEKEQEIQRVLKRLKAYYPDILNMAGIYEKAEDHAVQVTSQLKPDVALV